MSKVNIFVDMDGVLAIWDDEKSHEMYSEGFFLNLAPHHGTVELVRNLMNDRQLEVFILSTLLLESEFIEDEKNKWLDKYLPEVPYENRFFVPEGVSKSDYLNNAHSIFKGKMNVLIDDYTVNLLSWKDSGYFGLKMLNGRNGSNGLWLRDNPSAFLSYDDNPKSSYYKIVKMLRASDS